MSTNYLDSLKRQADATRAAGHEPRQDLLDKIELETKHVADNQAATAARKAQLATEQAARDKANAIRVADRAAKLEERAKHAARPAYLAQGGTLAGFEKDWPAIFAKSKIDKAAAVASQPRRRTMRSL